MEVENLKQKQENDSKGKGKSGDSKKSENKEMSKLKVGEEGGLTLKGFNDFK